MATTITGGSKSSLSQIEYIVTKRQKNLDYLKRVHNGGVHWLNVALITREDIENAQDPFTIGKRTEQWFYLGFSLAKILELPPGSIAVRAVAQLMEEYEYHFANSAVQGFKFMMAKHHTGGPPQCRESGESEPVRPVIYRSGKTPSYEYLTTPNLPCRLDYFQVVFSLCEVLSLAYSKFLDISCTSPVIAEAIVKLDAKIKHHIFSVISRELTQAAMSVLKSQMGQLHSMFSSADMSEEDFQALFVEVLPHTEQGTDESFDALSLDDD